MIRKPLSLVVAALSMASVLPWQALADPPVHVTYLWHLEQPIYWPGPNDSGRRYQTAWDSLQARWSGAAHPENDLDQIFSKDDRVAVYQWRVRDAVAGLLDLADAGVQVSYSGGLIENVASLGQAGQLGYGSGWSSALREARQWRTSGGHPRVDMVQLPFHHALIPLIDPEVLRMELALYRQAYGETWGTTDLSTGLFPSEMAFAEHTIPVLVEAGIEWVVVSNAHVSRACEDYPFVAGSGGDNIPPPNRADVQNPAQGTYNRISIDRGVSPANAVPFAYRPHYARYVDPETGVASRLVVVPAAQSESWRDGYSCFGVGDIDALATHNDPSHPMLVVLAHDGDNAFGGGFSYYHECTPNFAHAAESAGHRMTTIAQYLTDHPVDANDVVHVESGAWVNADGDFGAPSFLNWNWPLVDPTGQVDIPGGWAEDERNWAVITAATNHVLHATAVNGPPRVAEVLDPSGGASDVEIAWHFLLGALNSGYMYYGAVLDMELKPSVACNQAVARADAAIGGGGDDPTGPTLWLPQRYPDNPGGANFGPLYGYRDVTGSSDFWVWTFAHDVSGVDDVTLWVRRDLDGVDPLMSDDNQTFDGGPGVGDWVAIPMTFRDFPRGNVFGFGDISDEIQPTVIADEYYAVVEGYTDVLLDYFVEAVDTHGNASRSPIQHVYVGDFAGGAGDPDEVHWRPRYPASAEAVAIYAPDPGRLHWGVNGWQLPDDSYWPDGTEPFGDDLSVETPLVGPDADGFYAVTLGPFDGAQSIEQIDFVIHRADGSWDNNGGSDYRVTFYEDPPDGPDGGAGPDAGAPDTGSGADAGGQDADAGGADAGADGSDGGADAGETGRDDEGADGQVGGETDTRQEESGESSGGGASSETGGTPGSSPLAANEQLGVVADEPSGCGCHASATTGSTGVTGCCWHLLLAGLALIVTRRRRRPSPR